VCEIAPDSSVKDYPLLENIRPSAPSENAPEVILTIRHQTASTQRVHRTPAENPGWHYANGGNYAGARDPRWHDLAWAELVSIHGRHEGPTA
jgi:hypothetical protein